MNVSANGVKFVGNFEGCRLHSYQDIVGVWTIGYGHINGVKRGDVWTQAKADATLTSELQAFGNQVGKLLKVVVNQNQFDALTSFAYNLGSQALASSTLLQHVNAKQFDKAADEFLKWNKARVNGVLQPVQGLTNRRTDERTLFMKPVASQSVVKKK